MKYLLLLVCIIVQYADSANDLYLPPKDGRYSTVFDTLFKTSHDPFELLIKDSIVVKKARFHLDHVYKMHRISEDHYLLIDANISDTAGLSSLQKQLLSLGQPYYEIDGKIADTLYFKYQQNPHILINAGRFVRK